MADSSPQPAATSTTEPKTTTATATTAPQPTTDALRYLVNDPARTGFDPEMKWWMNYFRMISGRMTPEGRFFYRESRYKVHEERDCKRCDMYRDWLLTNSPTIRFLSEKIEDLNGKLDGSNIVCKRCPARMSEDGVIHRQSGGFSPDHGIMICANEIRNRAHVEDTMAHEMIHAWDHLRWQVDHDGDNELKHAACTEVRASPIIFPAPGAPRWRALVLACADLNNLQIRAAMLSGECRWTREALTRRNFSLTQQFQRCVRRRAIESILGRSKCKDDVHATKVVNQVWDSCFSDTRPFDEVYR